MGEVIVHIENIIKVYQKGTNAVRVLEGINIDINKGDFIALMGPSGSGKTTLLNLIAGIDRPTSGKLFVGDTDITTLSDSGLARWRGSHIGYIFQLYNLLPVLTAYENVELPLLLTNLSASERKNHVVTALKLVSLEDRMYHYPRQLSGGQEQRVGIARAIVTDPTLIIADEPTGDLDAKSAVEILGLLTQLNNQLNKTIVMVTHDPKAAKYAHTLYRLEKGVLVSSETAIEQEA
ncbi:MAG: ABC transporter ATP-binding protein [Planctomycetes bacterium RBG_16_43_13]|nr:MAG: ABC transporter ATP-binding protein [Planctomycetes bacterium RBG_16_43_13]